MSKQLVRSLKNITNGYSSVEIQVRNATSNDPWGPSSAELHEVALLTYHEKYIDEIMNILEKRLNDKGKNWRHVMKALTLLLYCVYEGSEDVVSWLKRNIHLVKTLREFRYADSKNIDQGGPIRTKSRVLTELVQDDDKLQQEKQNYARIRQQMGKPGIVNLNADSTRRVGSLSTAFNNTSSRMSLDSGQSPPSPTSPSPPPEKNKRSSLSFQRTRPSFEGRYSLSLPTALHAIEEEGNNNTDLVQIASREVAMGH